MICLSEDFLHAYLVHFVSFFFWNSLQAYRIFADADVNGDGQLELCELVRAIAHHSPDVCHFIIYHLHASV